MKIKLSPSEERKLIMAINDESHYREMLQASSQHRQDIFELVTSHHNIDLSEVDQRSGTIQDGHLILPELSKKSQA